MREPHAMPMNWIAQAYQDQGDYGKAIEFYERDSSDWTRCCRLLWPRYDLPIYGQA